MNIQHSLTVAALAALLGGLIVPALAQAPGTADGSPDRGMSTGRMGQGMGHGMMSHGMMSGGMMGGGCAGMMQSMNGGDGRPNSQWRAHPPSGGPLPE